MSSGISVRTLSLIVKDLLGLGYLGSCVVLSLCGFALWSTSVARGLKLFLLASILLPVAGVLIIDSVAGYFLAIRQMIFVLPSIALLAAFGFESLSKKGWTRLGWSFLAILLVFQTIGIVSWFRKPRENWDTASRLLRKDRSRYECIIFVPDEASRLYGIFDPRLPSLRCSSSELKSASTVAVSISSAANALSSNPDYQRIKALGFGRTVSLSSGDPAIVIFSRK